MNDRFTVRAVVVGLIIIALAVIIGAIVLALSGNSVPDPLWGLAGMAVGAIAGILSRTNTEPDPVTNALATQVIPAVVTEPDGGTKPPAARRSAPKR